LLLLLLLLCISTVLQALGQRGCSPVAAASCRRQHSLMLLLLLLLCLCTVLQVLG
jgi:hypothetical protein